jgi:hypothetical protein
MTPTADHLATLRARATAGASLLELIDYVHDATGIARHKGRIVTLHWFREAFGLQLRDLLRSVAPCEIFGDGSPMKLAEAERLFRQDLDLLKTNLTL